MSKKTSRDDSPSNGSEFSKPPEGYENVTAERTDNPAYVRKKPGLTIEGRLLGRFNRKRGRGAYYQIRLKATAPAVRKDKESGGYVDVQLQPGEILSVDESKALEDMRELASDGGTYDVWIQFGKEMPLEGGHSFWPAQIKKHTIRPPIQRAEETADDDTPF